MENFREILINIYGQTNQFGRDLGMELTKFDSDEINYELTIQEKHLATPTTAHGGVIAAYMDGILGVAALYASSENAKLVSTVEFKINFLSPVKLNDQLLGVGKIVSKGNRVIVVQGEIINIKTKAKVAIASGTFNAYPYQKSGMDFKSFDLEKLKNN